MKWFEHVMMLNVGILLYINVDVSIYKFLHNYVLQKVSPTLDYHSARYSLFFNLNLNIGFVNSQGTGFTNIPPLGNSISDWFQCITYRFFESFEMKFERNFWFFQYCTYNGFLFFYLTRTYISRYVSWQSSIIFLPSYIHIRYTQTAIFWRLPSS